MEVASVTIGQGLSKTSFNVLHNLDDFGFDIQRAANAWVTKRHNLTIEMFCRYIRQQNGAFICVTLEEARKISNHLKFKI